jgi:polyphenol oxidase
MMNIFEVSTQFGSFKTYNQKPPLQLIEVNQIHSPDLLTVSDMHHDNLGTADGILCASADKNLAIKTADCLAILIEGSHGLCLLHAGWRGLASGILGHAGLKKILPTHAYLSPCISSRNYEVTQEFTQNFPKSDFFTQRDGKLFWSLEGEACDQLQNLFPQIVISLSGICTFSNSQLHSYRRDKTNQRNWNIFIPRLK